MCICVKVLTVIAAECCCASLQLFPPRMFAEHNWMHITCADLFCIHLSPAQPSPAQPPAQPSPASPAVGNICSHCSTCVQALPGGGCQPGAGSSQCANREMGRAAVLHSVHTIYMAAVCNVLRGVEIEIFTRNIRTDGKTYVCRAWWRSD